MRFPFISMIGGFLVGYFVSHGDIWGSVGLSVVSVVGYLLLFHPYFRSRRGDIVE